MTICGLFLFRAKAPHVKRVFCAEAPNCKHGSARLGRKTLNHAFNFGETDTQITESICHAKSIKKDYKPLQFTRGILHGVYRVYKTSIGERVNARTFFLSIR